MFGFFCLAFFGSIFILMLTRITYFGLSVLSWNTWPRGTHGPQAGIPHSQGQCPVDPWCEQVPRAWAASRLVLSETHPCTVWSVHSRPWVLFHPSADVHAVQSVDIWVASMAGLLRVELLWSFSVGLRWTCIGICAAVGMGWAAGQFPLPNPVLDPVSFLLPGECASCPVQRWLWPPGAEGAPHVLVGYVSPPSRKHPDLQLISLCICWCFLCFS